MLKRLPPLASLLLLPAFLLTGGSVRAAVYRVSASSTAIHPDGFGWATAYRCVQAGLDAAEVGDEVWVAGGTYGERITLNSGIGLYGGFDGSETDRGQRDWTKNVTVLDANRAGSVVTVPPAATPDTVIDGFTLQHGTGTQFGSYRQGGGLYCDQSSPTVRNNTFLENGSASVPVDGAGMFLRLSSAVITGNTFRANVAQYGGGAIFEENSTLAISGNAITENRTTDIISRAAGIGGYNGTLTITGNTFTDNVCGATIDADAPDQRGGGGIWFKGATVSIVGNTLQHNVGGLYGGGILLSNCTAGISGNAFTANSAARQGGAIFVTQSSASIFDNTISENSAGDSSAAFNPAGGGIFLTASTGIIARNQVEDNTLQSASSYGWGGGMWCDGPSVTICDNVIMRNNAGLAPGGGGGGIQFTAGTVLIERNDIRNNVAGGGAGVTSGRGSTTLRDNLITGNASGGRGGAVYLVDADALVVNNTLVNNTAADGGGVLTNGTTKARLVNNIVALNNSGLFQDATSTMSVMSNCVALNGNYNYAGLADQTGIYGNIGDNPGFANGDSGDYHLTDASNCVDVGDDTVVMAGQRDLDGKPRILARHVDMGAYEFGNVGIPTIADAVEALKVTGGLAVLTDADRLNVDRGVPSNATVDMYDVLWILRQAAGLESSS